MNVLRRESPRDAEEVLHSILDEIKERMMASGEHRGAAALSSSSSSRLVVTKKLLSDVVADLSRDEGDVTDEAMQLLDAFDMPRLKFDPMRKQFTLLSETMEEKGRSLHGEAVDKVEMFAQRYALIQQRILRQDLFRPKLVPAEGRHTAEDSGSGTLFITPVESLLGRSGVKFLLGMIVQVEEGIYYLEDHTGQVPMDLSQASILTEGFITENCIVLIEGEMIDGMLRVHRMGNPLVETRAAALDAIGMQNSDIFNSMSSLAEVEKLHEQELHHGQEGMFVILSDVHLDRPAVMEKLEKLFDGFRDMSPLPVFVFMGNFTSKPLSAAADGIKMMMGYYEELANVICKFSNMASEGRFIFVPGPNDPGLSDVMPRSPIPQYFTGSIRSKVPHAIFTSNPCRIRYFSKEIVFCREDLVSKLRRNCLVKPRGDGEANLARHAVKTVLDQGHLCPLPLPSCPIYWQYDHALRLYPLPDAVVVGDRVDQYNHDYYGCDAINPGPFPNDFSFIVYRPVGEVDDEEQTKSVVEFSQIE